MVALNLPDRISASGKSAIRESLAPLQLLIANSSQRFRQVRDFVTGLGDLATENQQLAEEMIRLRTERRLLETYEVENQELRRQLGFLSRAQLDWIPAEVIARDISGWWQTVRLGKGRSDGIERRMAVVTPDGLVGYAMDVSDATTDVLLISDPSCKVSVYLPRSGAYGIASGHGLSIKGEPTLRMEFINKNLDIRPGDEVVTSGLGGNYPKGILLGHVERVHTDVHGLYQEADLVATADLGRLRFVFIIAQIEDSAERLLRRRISEERTP